MVVQGFQRIFSAVLLFSGPAFVAGSSNAQQSLDEPRLIAPVFRTQAPYAIDFDWTAVDMRKIEWFDGDSGEIDSIPFRLANADAPELGDDARCEEERVFGAEYKFRTEAMTRDRNVIVTKDYGEDDFGRRVVDLTVSELDGKSYDLALFNLTLNWLRWRPLEGGKALAPKHDWCAEFLARAEKAAQKTPEFDTPRLWNEKVWREEGAKRYARSLGAKEKRAETSRWLYELSLWRGDSTIERASEINQQYILDARRALGKDGIASGDGIAVFPGSLNDNQVVELIETAAAAGHQDSQRILGMMFALGVGREQNDKSAVCWLLKAADNTDDKALWALQTLRDNGVVGQSRSDCG